MNKAKPTRTRAPGKKAANHVSAAAPVFAKQYAETLNPEHGWTIAKQRTRQALTSAAVKLFQQKGYEATTVEDIARAAGSSSRSFFRYFGAKEDVLFLDVPEILQAFQTHVEQAHRSPSRWQVVREGIVEAALRFYQIDEDLGKVSIMSWLNEPAIARRFGELSRELENIMIRALSSHTGKDAAADLRVQLLARSATAVYLSAFQVHVTTGTSLRRLLVRGFELLENGISEA